MNFAKEFNELYLTKLLPGGLSYNKFIEAIKNLDKQDASKANINPSSQQSKPQTNSILNQNEKSKDLKKTKNRADEGLNDDEEEDDDFGIGGIYG